MNARRTIALACAFISCHVQAGTGLGTWCSLETANHHLISDLDVEAQSSLVELLTRFEQVTSPYLPGEAVAQPGPLKIIVFSRRGDFLKLTGKHKFAAYMQPSLRTNRLLIGPVRGSLTETTLHEYAHFLGRNRLDVSLPTWFDEGLASLLGAIEFSDTDTGPMAVVGRLPASRMRERTSTGPTRASPQHTLSATLAASSVERWPQDRINAFYDWSWLLVHYLYFVPDGSGVDRRDDLSRFLAGDRDLLRHLDATPRQLVKSLERHLRNPPQTTVAVAPIESLSGVSRCLDPFERDHELARAIMAQQPRTALRLIEPYFESVLESVDLLVTRARIQLILENLEASQLYTDAALVMDPDHAAAQILSADLAVRDCLFTFDERCRDQWRTATDLYRSALKADPTRFDAILGLGLAYLYTGRPGEAVNYLRVAYTRAPWAAVTNYYLGEAFRLVGDTRARGYLENARNWAALEVWQRLAEESLRLLTSYSERETQSPVDFEKAR